MIENKLFAEMFGDRMSLSRAEAVEMLEQQVRILRHKIPTEDSAEFQDQLSVVASVAFVGLTYEKVRSTVK